ncbi:MAG: hypothetical protein ACI9K1_002291 [Arcticibacterium sp.]
MLHDAGMKLTKHLEEQAKSEQNQQAQQ